LIVAAENSALSNRVSEQETFKKPDKPMESAPTGKIKFYTKKGVKLREKPENSA